MTYVRLNQDWHRHARRVLITGSPNSGKTTSLSTFPAPVVGQVYPGEKGTVYEPEGCQMWVPEPIDPDKPQDWGAIRRDVERFTIDILGGKHGPYRTFAGDGLHKLYQVYLAEATNGASAKGEQFDPRLYGSAGTRFFSYVDRVCRSVAEYVVFTVWDGLEKDDPDEKGSNPSRHIFPDLPGKAAKHVMGEFAVVLYAEREGSGPAARYVWQTQPLGKVWGAGTKLPPTVAKRIPPKVPQNWATLEPIIVGETK